MSRNRTVSPGREGGEKGDTRQRQGPGWGEGASNRLGGRSRKDAGRFPPLTGSSCTAWSRVGQRYTGPVRFPTIRQEREAIATLARGCPEREDGASRGLQETEAGNAKVGAKMPFFFQSLCLQAILLCHVTMAGGLGMDGEELVAGRTGPGATEPIRSNALSQTATFGLARLAPGAGQRTRNGRSPGRY